MRKFEYKETFMKDTPVDVIGWLNEEGEYGWELVTILISVSGFLFLFKREGELLIPSLTQKEFENYTELMK